MFLGPFTRCSAVLITVVRLLSIRVDDLCLFFFNLLPGLLDESLFIVTETRSLPF